jgi:hypothetical protein
MVVFLHHKHNVRFDHFGGINAPLILNRIPAQILADISNAMRLTVV